MRRSRVAAVLVAALFLSAAAILRVGCGEPGDRLAAGDAAQNLLLVTVESLGPADLAAAEEGAFPALKDFVRAGSVMDDAIAASPDPLAALASILSAARPSAHGVSLGRDEPLPNDAMTLAIALRSRGFATEAFVSSALPIASRGLLRGFETFDDGGGAGPGERPATALTDAALEAARTAGAERARRFTWVHFGGAAARGDGAKEIGRLLDRYARLTPSPTLEILVGLGSPPPSLPDPGAPPLPDDVLRAAVVLGGLERVARGRRAPDLVSALDVAPTALDALAFPPEPSFDGTSVLPVLLAGRAVRAHAPVEACDPFDRPGGASLRAVVTRGYVFADASGEFDLRRRDAAGRAIGEDESETLPDVVEEMRRRIRDPRSGRGGGRSRGDSRRGGPRSSPARAAPAAAAEDAPGALARARALADAGDIGAALDACHDAIAESPDDPRLPAQRGEIFLRAGDAESAARDAREALRLDPSLPFAHALAGRAALRRNDLAGAERALRRAAELRPRSPGAAAEWGGVLFALGRHAEAAVALEAAARLDPSSAETLVALARALLASADGPMAPSRARAEEALRLAIARDPRRADARLLLADLIESRGDHAKAGASAATTGESLAHLRAAAKALPASPEVLSRYAAALENAGSPAEAAEEYRRALALEPDRAEALLGLARTLPPESRDAARECLERAVAAAPHSAAARRALGELLLAEGKTGAGLTLLEEAAFRSPGDPDGFARLGAALVDAGRPHAAEDALRRALAADGAHLAAIVALSRLLSAGAEGFPRRPMESVELSRRAVTMHPAAPIAWNALARALEASGRRDEAAGARLREARLHLQAGRPADAIAALDACEGIDSGPEKERARALRHEAESLAASMAATAPEPAKTKTTTAEPGDARR